MLTAGDRIRMKRIENGLSQEELAKRMGLAGRSSVTRLEKSKDISMKNVKRVADALGCSYQYLLGWEDKLEILSNERNEVIESIMKEDSMLSEDELILVEAYRSADATKRMKAYALLLGKEL